MANHPSAVKRHRQSLKRKARHAAQRSRVLTTTRKLEKAIQDKDKNAAEELLKTAVSDVMGARSKGTYHRNTASRKIARLHRFVNRSFS